MKYCECQQVYRYIVEIDYKPGIYIHVLHGFQFQSICNFEL